MMTSALALSQILSIVSREPDDQRFLTAAAKCLAMTGPEAEMDVLRQLVRTANQIESDIVSLQLDDTTTNVLKKDSAPFNGIRNLSHIHQTIKQAKASFMKAEHLVGLNRLHAAFAHTCPQEGISEDARRLAVDFKEALLKLRTSKVPAHLKEDLERHLHQIIAALENHYFFSGKQLDYSLEGLVGTFVLNAEEAEEHTEALQPVKKVTAKLLGAIATTGKYVGIGRKLVEDGAEILDVLGKTGS